MAERHAEKRISVTTPEWPGEEASDSEPLRGIVHRHEPVRLEFN